MRYVPSVDDRERARLVEDNVELARKAAGVIYPRVRAHVTFEEVTSLANAGLAEAAARFDPDRGVAFTTFAWYRCYGAVMDGLRRAANLPRREWAKLVALRGAAAYLEQRGERELGARATGAPPPDSREALLAIRSALEAIKTIYMTSLEALVDREAEPPAPAAHELVEHIDTARMGRRIRIAIRALPERERELLKKHYFEGKDLDEAGSELGISKSWASRLHARAVERLRAAVGGEEDTA
jgi:RNA polymerase sigma factor FliA